MAVLNYFILYTQTHYVSRTWDFCNVRPGGTKSGRQQKLSATHLTPQHSIPTISEAYRSSTLPNSQTVTQHTLTGITYMPHD